MQNDEQTYSGKGNVNMKKEQDMAGTSNCALYVSVQGSFHQGNLMFGENAGTQCVANSLTALAYHKVKNAKQWQTEDMNKILATGDEMYSYLQQSSTVGNRYLLVSELPQYFECFDEIASDVPNKTKCIDDTLL